MKNVMNYIKLVCLVALMMTVISTRASVQGNDKRWYIKNNLQKHDVSINFFNWLELDITQKYDLNIPTFVLPVERPIKIGVLDSLDLNHPKLAKFLLPDKSGIKSNTPMELAHGTSTTGVMTAVFESLNLGTIKPEDIFKILPLQLISGQDNFNLKFELKRLLQQAIDEDVDILSTSLTWPKYLHDEEIASLLKKLTSKGVIIIVAAGNHHSQVNDTYPCMYKESLCVGGASYDGSMALYFDSLYESGSNYGPEVDILAPSVGIYTYQFLNGYDFSEKFFERMMKYDNGTSYAQPMVTAQLALLKSLYPSETTDQLKARVLLTSKNRNSQLPTFFKDVSSSQFGAVSFADSILFDRNTISTDNIPVYLKRTESILYVERNATQLNVPVALKCLIDSGCREITTTIQVWQKSIGGSAQTITQTQVEWGQKSEVNIDLNVAINSQKENRLHYKITSSRGLTAGDNQPLTKIVQGHWPVQIKMDYTTENYIDIDSQMDRDRYSGVRRLNPSSFYSGIEFSKFNMYVTPNSKTPLISIVDLKNKSQSGKVIPGVTLVKMGFIGDANNDGQPDIQLITQNADKKIYLYYLDMDLNFLIPEFSAPVELNLALANKEPVFPNDSSNIKWSRQMISGQSILVPWFIDKYPVIISQKFLGLAPKAFREVVNNMAHMQTQIVRFKAISKNQFEAVIVSDLNFYTDLYSKLNLGLHAELKIVGPKNYEAKNSQILIYAGERGQEFNKILTVDSEKDFAIFLSDTPFNSVLNPMRSSIKNVASEIQNTRAIFYLDQYSPNQLAFYYSSAFATFEFGLVSKVPVRRVLGAYEVQGQLHVMILNNLGLELWSATPQMNKAVLKSFYPISYAATYTFMENISRFVAKQYLPNGLMDVRIYNSFSGGDSYTSVSQNMMSGELEARLEKSLTVPPRCIPWEVSNLRLAPNESLFEVFFCPEKDKQKLFILSQ